MELTKTNKTDKESRISNLGTKMQLHTFFLSSSKGTFFMNTRADGIFSCSYFLKVPVNSKQEVYLSTHSQQIFILIWILYGLSLGKEELKVSF